MLEYYPIEYAETVLSEIRRVLKPGKDASLIYPILITKKHRVVNTSTNTI